MSKQVILENKGSLITYKDTDGTDRCLGNLMHFEGHGTYDPSLGQVDVTKEDADKHNAALDTALIEGLKGCKVGQGNFFYLGHSPLRVHTFTGKEVTRSVTVKGTSVTFTVNNMTFKGKLQKDAQCFNFTRTA